MKFQDPGRYLRSEVRLHKFYSDLHADGLFIVTGASVVRVALFNTSKFHYGLTFEVLYVYLSEIVCVAPYDDYLATQTQL